MKQKQLLSMKRIDSMMLLNQSLWELWRFFLQQILHVSFYLQNRNFPEHATTNGIVQAPGTINGTSGQSLWLFPCLVHSVPFSSYKSFHCDSSVQYFDKFSPISNALIQDTETRSRKIFRFKKLLLDIPAVRTMQDIWRKQKIT